MSGRRFWIRKDREQYLLSGFIIAGVISSFVSSYWHFSDRMQVKRTMKITPGARKEPAKRLKEVQFSPPKLKVGATRYYRLDEGTAPSVPEPGADDGN